MVPTVKGDTMSKTVDIIMTANMVGQVMGYMAYLESLLHDDMRMLHAKTKLEHSIWDAMSDAADKIDEARKSMDFLVAYLELNEK